MDAKRATVFPGVSISIFNAPIRVIVEKRLPGADMNRR